MGGVGGVLVGGVGGVVGVDDVWLLLCLWWLKSLNMVLGWLD